MTSTIIPNSKASSSVSPVLGDGVTPSKATLGPITFTTSDPTICTVANDPAVPTGCIVTSLAPGTAIVSASAVATEPDGTTTETIVGSLTVIVATPAPGPAAALVFTPLVPIAA